MSKSDQNAAKKQANDTISKNNTNEAASNTQLQGLLGGFKGTADNLLPGVTAGYSDIASSGGYNPAITGTVNDTYTKLATTGGISDADATAMRSRAATAASSTYETAAADAQRRSAATGGYGDVSAAVAGNLARAGSHAAETGVVDADAAIAGQRTAGMATGAAGLTNVQQNLTANKLAATGGLSNVYGMNLTEMNATVDNILKNYQQTGQLNNQDLSILTNLANQPGVFDKIVGTIGTLGGAAAGVIGAVKGHK